MSPLQFIYVNPSDDPSKKKLLEHEVGRDNFVPRITISICLYFGFGLPLPVLLFFAERLERAVVSIQTLDTPR
jgi:hypothetical protein